MPNKEILLPYEKCKNSLPPFVKLVLKHIPMVLEINKSLTIQSLHKVKIWHTMEAKDV